MPGGFGFARYPQRPTPSSEAVGMALMQRGQMAQGQPMQPGPGAALETGSPDGGFQSPAAPPDSALREAGAGKMTGPGQIDDNATDDDGAHSANAVNVAIGEALTRMGGGYKTNPNPFKDRARHMQNLQQLGLSAIEAQLLARTGGV